MKKAKTAHQKGNELEQAIGSIERTILQHSSGLSDKSYKILFRKIIVVDGIKHEIDVWVEFDIGGGYKAIFIFESKNWKKRVGKDHLLVFSKKIEAAKAQAGFFVAKSISKYASAAAKLDPRISVLVVDDDFLGSDLPSRFHHIVRDGSKSNSNVHFVTKPPTPLLHPHIANIDMETAVTYVNGVPMPCKAYSYAIIEQAIGEHMNRLPTNTFEDGIYVYEIKKEITIAPPDALQINELEVEKIELAIKYQLEVVRPTIISKFQIETRGRVYTFDTVRVGDAGTSQLTLVEAFVDGMTKAGAVVQQTPKEV